MTDKLVKGSVDIETAEAFTRAIGDAIEKNDVEAAQVLSSELRKKVAAQMCSACQHNDSAHWPSGECKRCDCKQFASSESLAQIMRRVKTERSMYFPEGKHFAKLRKIDLQKDRRGSDVIVFELIVTASETLPVGGTEPMYHYMRTDSDTRMMLAASQIRRLNLDPFTARLALDLDVVVVVAPMATSTGGVFMSTTLRLPDDEDGK